MKDEHRSRASHHSGRESKGERSYSMIQHDSHQHHHVRKRHSTSSAHTISSPSSHSLTELHSEKDIYGQCKPVSLYDSYRHIGQGTYGTVYRATHTETSQLVALKRIILHNESTEGFPITSIREIATLRSIQHQNCIKLLDIVVNSHRDGVFLVFEYCEHDLASLLTTYSSAFTESESKSLVLQLLSAISYLHDHWIIHRGEVKLADFGLARKYSYPIRPMTPKVVTLWYRAPELLLGCSSYTPAIDVWAIGCVFAELLLNKPLFPGEDDLNQLDHIFSLLGTPTVAIWPTLTDCSLIKNHDLNLQLYQQKYRYNHLNRIFPHLSTEGFDFLNCVLTYDPLRRITARKAITHSYFDTSPYPKEPDLMPTFPTKHDDETSVSLDHSRGQDLPRLSYDSNRDMIPSSQTITNSSSTQKKRQYGAL